MTSSTIFLKPTDLQCKDDIYHVYPVNDIREHELLKECWCKPTEHPELPEVYVHNSMDGREDFEEGKRKLS